MDNRYLTPWEDRLENHSESLEVVHCFIHFPYNQRVIYHTQTATLLALTAVDITWVFLLCWDTGDDRGRRIENPPNYFQYQTLNEAHCGI